MSVMIPYAKVEHVEPARPTRSVAKRSVVLAASIRAASVSRRTHVIPYRETFYEFCTRYFVEEKVDLTMSKGSLMGLVVGLMLLGILFFLSGFLAAVHLYSPGSSPASIVPEVHDPLASPYHLPTQPTYATSSSSRMPRSSSHLPATPQRAVVVPPSRQPSEYVMKPPYTIEQGGNPAR